MDAKGFFAASRWVFVLAFLLNVSPLWSQSLNHLWSQRFGGTGFDTGAEIAVDGAGNVLVTGQFSGTVDFGGGPLTNAGSRDIFLAKYDAAGAHLWSQRFGDTDFDSGAAIAVDEAGNVLVTGSFEGTVDFGGGALTSAGSREIFLAKYDAAGAHLFSQRFGDTDFDSGAAIAVDGAGNVLVTGSFEGTVDFGGGALTSAGSDIFLAKYALPVFAPLPAVSGWGLLAIVSVTLLLGCVLLTRRRTRNGLAPESLT